MKTVLAPSGALAGRLEDDSALRGTTTCAADLTTLSWTEEDRWEGLIDDEGYPVEFCEPLPLWREW